jgi:hypothetical protein
MFYHSDGDPTGGPVPPTEDPTPGQEPKETPPAGEKTDDAAEAERLKKELSDARKEAASYRTKLRDAEAKATAETEQKLKDDAKWKELAEAREARVMELEPLEAKVTAYEARETARITETVKDWPDNLRKIVEKAGTLEQKLAAVDDLSPTVAELQKAAATPGSGPTPKPNGEQGAKVTLDRPVRF